MADILHVVGGSGVTLLWIFLLGVALVVAAVSGGHLIVKRFIEKRNDATLPKFAAWTIGLLGVLCIGVSFFAGPAVAVVGSWFRPSENPNNGSASSSGPTTLSNQPSLSSSTITESPAIATSTAPRLSSPVSSAAISSPAGRTASSPLYLDVDGSLSQYKAGPNQYRADHDIKFTVHVSDDVGEVSSGCYAKVTVLRAGTVIMKDEAECSPGWGWINLHQGSYTLRFDVTTDWGANGSKSISIQMVP
ncbi:hypothetical protein ACWEVP_37790 [Amycolatopsis sp. NPDC003865]